MLDRYAWGVEVGQSEAGTRAEWEAYIAEVMGDDLDKLTSDEYSEMWDCIKREGKLIDDDESEGTI